MKYNIILRSRKEIAADMAEEEVRELWVQLRNGEIKMIKIGDGFYNVSEIASIEPSNERVLIPSKFRLPEGHIDFEKVGACLNKMEEALRKSRIIGKKKR